MVKGSWQFWFMVQGSRFKVYGSRFMVHDSIGFKVTSGSLLMVKGYGLWKKRSITRNGAVREKQP